MKFFKCGKCQTQYKIDETKITNSQAVLTCSKCGAKNLIKFGVRLQIISKDEKGLEHKEVITLKDGSNIIGRKSQSASADILLNDEFVSRKHAAVHIEKKDGKIFISIEDLNSSNGTLNKDRKKLNPGKRYPILPGSPYFIGNSTITLFNN